MISIQAKDVDYPNILQKPFETYRCKSPRLTLISDFSVASDFSSSLPIIIFFCFVLHLFNRQIQRTNDLHLLLQVFQLLSLCLNLDTRPLVFTPIYLKFNLLPLFLLVSLNGAQRCRYILVTICKFHCYFF